MNYQSQMTGTTMKPQEQDALLDLFKKSFEDHILTRKERAELNSSLKELALTENEKNVVRSKLFDIVRSEQNETNYPIILSWIEEVAKLLIRDYTEEKSSNNGCFFSPGDECRNAIVSFIRSAQKSLRICVFTISDDRIAKEITAAKRRGVAVQVITDDDKQFDRGSDIEYLKRNGIPVHCDESTAHMHHKFAVADHKALLTGSYNWTRSAATSNQENILITDDHSSIFSFIKEFDRLWKQFA